MDWGGWAVFGLVATTMLTAVLILLLAGGVGGWVAALVVAGLWGGGGGLVAVTGRGRVREGRPPAPEQTVETVKEDVQWAKTRAKSARR